eukprot:591144-Pyramimonas_sp.AAC.1
MDSADRSASVVSNVEPACFARRPFNALDRRREYGETRLPPLLSQQTHRWHPIRNGTALESKSSVEQLSWKHGVEGRALRRARHGCGGRAGCPWA